METRNNSLSAGGVAAERQLLGPEHVEWLKVTAQTLFGLRKEPRQAAFFKGLLKFAGRRPQPVAVKVFDSEFHLMDGSQRRELSGLIRDLYSAGVRMPKMGVLEHAGRPVLVSSLFVRRGQTMLTELSEMDPAFDYDAHPEFTLEAARQLGLVTRAGWTPRYVAEDFLHLTQTRRGLVPVIADVDLLHFYKLHMADVAGRPQFEQNVPATPDGRKFPMALNAIHEFFLCIRDPELQARAIRKFHGKLTPRQRRAFLHQLDPDNPQGIARAIRHWQSYIEPEQHLRIRRYNRIVNALDASSG